MIESRSLCIYGLAWVSRMRPSKHLDPFEQHPYLIEIQLQRASVVKVVHCMCAYEPLFDQEDTQPPDHELLTFVIGKEGVRASRNQKANTTIEQHEPEYKYPTTYHTVSSSL